MATSSDHYEDKSVSVSYSVTQEMVGFSSDCTARFSSDCTGII